MPEVLVLLHTSAGVTARDVTERAPIAGTGAQLFGRRVVIVRLTDPQCAEVAASEAVAGVYSGPVPDDAELPDDVAGQMAVGAWNERRQAGVGKQRIGEGAAWDDPRFEREGRPPDDD